jgi:hypothetical protein
VAAQREEANTSTSREKVRGCPPNPRDIQERISFFRIPAVAREVFPDAPVEVVVKVLDRIMLSAWSSVQERNVYTFIAERLEE